MGGQKMDSDYILAGRYRQRLQPEKITKENITSLLSLVKKA